MAFVSPSPMHARRAWTTSQGNVCSTPLKPSRGLSYLKSEETRIAKHAVHWRSPSASASPPAATTAHGHKLIDGKSTALQIRQELREKIERLVATNGEAGRPSLAVVLVGERPDSMTYVRSKRKVCEELGITSHYIKLDGDVGEAELQKIVYDLNERSDIDGILIQLPLPKTINEENILHQVSLHKDVDGFHPLNIGRLCMSGRIPPLFIPCTPRACVELLDRYNVEIEGKNVVVIGRSNIVGLPVAMLLMHRNATVTICHSRTNDIKSKCQQADIIIAACGRPNFVEADWLKKDCVIVDVGINAVDDATKKKGYRLVGDVDFEGAVDVAKLITPVPGGVGPMTIAMLMQNTYEAAVRRLEDTNVSVQGSEDAEI